MLKGVNCHSAFKHYEMFHSNRGGSNYGSIFNTTYNIDCGGHGGGFWSGLGYGLGNAFAGLFGGMFAGGFNMGNMFGGFGNMFGGFGMPALSNFGGWNWGAGGATNTNKTCNCNCDSSKKTKDIKDKEEKDTKDLKNDDQKICTEFHGKVNEIMKKPNVTAQELKTLYDEIVAAKNKATDPLKEQDEAQFDKVLEQLNDFAKSKGFDDLSNKDFDPNKKTTSTDEGNSTTETDPSNQTEETTKPPVKDAVTINGKDVKLADLTPKQILENLTPEQIKGLDSNQAKALLKKLGIEDGEVAKNTNVRSVLLLLQKSGIKVKLAENTNSLINDQWIIGTISNVSKDGNISYDVDCNNESSTQKNKYHFAQKDSEVNKNTFVVTVTEFGTVDNKQATYKDPNVQSVEYQYSENEYLQRNGQAFTTIEEIEE